MIRDVNDNKKKKIDEILSIVKISSLLFSAIAFLQYSFIVSEARNVSPYYGILSVSVSILLLLAIYIFWSFSVLNRYKDNIDIIQWIEIILFIFIFLAAILVSGANTSNNKFLFLFIIITSTIQGEINRGVIVSIISSVIILF